MAVVPPSSSTVDVAILEDTLPPVFGLNITVEDALDVDMGATWMDMRRGKG